MQIISLINKLPGNPAAKGYWLYTHIPRQVLRTMEEDNFRGTVRWAAEHSPFYKKKFAERGIDAKKVRRPADLGDFFTTAEDIRECPEDFVCSGPDTAFETTGTTSKRPKRVYFSRSELNEAGWSGAVGLWGLGVRPEDRVASSFDYSFWVSGPILTASCRVLGCFHIEADRIDPLEFYERVQDYRINVIVGDPSWIVGLSEIAKVKGPWPVKLLVGGGENLTEGARRFVEEVWKTDFILSYGQTEAMGSLGIESRDKDGYQLNAFHNAFEIISADSEGYGELVYTTLNRRVMPLIRYRSGDITRFLEPHAAPPKGGSATLSGGGMPGQRISKLKGRVGDWTATAMGNVAPWIFEPIMKSIEGLGEDWQIVIDKEGNKDVIEFHVESENGQSAAQIKEKLLARIRQELSTAWRIYEMGLFKLDLRAHPKGTLRTGRKLERMVDRRKY